MNLSLALFIFLMGSSQLAFSWQGPLTEEEKAALKQLEQEVNQNSAQDSLWHLKLALLYYRDQELEKGLYSFLKAIELMPPTSSYIPSEQENQAYQAALEIYLNAQATDVQQGSDIILNRYAPLVAQNSQQPQLGFIVAAAFANKGDYVSSHELFYYSYSLLPEHYLAQKMIAILYLKLMEKLMPGQERERLQHKIVFHLKKALLANPADPLLYKLWLRCGTDRQSLISHVLNELIEKNVPMNRSDLSFFIEQAMLLEDHAALKQFIFKAKERFPGSRILSEAEKKLGHK